MYELLLLFCCPNSNYSRTLPLFVWHRQNWNIVYPHLSLGEESEIEALKTQSCYVAGFTDPQSEAHTDLYDIFINGKDYYKQVDRWIM